jgi:uncharacterized membrane protein
VDPMSPLGWLHTACALAALASGAGVLLRPKGTGAHRRLGWVYVGSMVALNATALLIYRLFGGFGPFHWAALASLATVVAGAWAARRRRPAAWVARHYWWMTLSYVGLVAAAVAEVATRLPGTTFWWAVLVPSAAVLGAGALLVARRASATIEPFLRPAGAPAAIDPPGIRGADRSARSG